MSQPGFLAGHSKRLLESYSAQLLRDQRGPELHEEERHLTHFIRWLLVDGRWEYFERIFEHDGAVDYDGFEEFVRFQEKYNGDARKVFDFLADSDDSVLRYRTFLAMRRVYISTLDMKRMGLSGLKKQMMQSYGSLARAWRRVFDKEDTGRVCMANFVSACRSSGFHGDIRNAWLELADGSTVRHICLKDWDPEADMLLRTFCKVLVQRHKQLREGWCAILKHGFGGKADGGHLSSQEFLDIVTGLGFSLRHAKIVLMAVDKDRDEVITMEEFLFVQQFGQGLEPPKELSERPDASRPPRRQDHGTMTSRERKNNEEPNRWASAPITDTPDKHNKDDEETIVQHTCSDKPPLDSNEFVVFMTKDEFNEYLRRRRKKTLSAMANEGLGVQYSKELREQRKQRRDSAAISQPILIHGSQPLPVRAERIERVRKVPQSAKQESRRTDADW